MIVLTMLLIAQVSAAPQEAGRADEVVEAQSYADEGKLSEAETKTRMYLTSYPGSAAGHFLLGYILFRQKKARESLGEYTEGAKYQRPGAPDLRVVGADYVLLGDYEDADKWFTKATDWAPRNVLGWYYLGRAKYHENRFEEAVSAFEQCLKLSLKDVRAEDNLGLSLQALGRIDEAQTAFLNAIAWESDAPAKDPWPYIDFGSFLLENNQPEKAVPRLQQAAQIAPDAPEAHRQLGKAYLALEQLDKAQMELETASKLDPDDGRVHYVLGQLYQKRGQSGKAKQEFTRYSQLSAAHSNKNSRE